MKKIITGCCIFVFIQVSVHAQQPSKYNLQQCIDTALVNNIQVRQNELLTETAKVNLKQAKANVLPDLNLGFDHNLNQGRSIDPFTNAYVNQSINYEGYGLTSGVTVFNGMILKNNIRQNKFAYAASQMELQQEKDNLTLNVILAYLTVLNNEDLLTSSIKQRELSAKQFERLQLLDSQGAVSPSQVSDVKGLLMNDELNILNLSNQLETSKLDISQLMNIPYDKSMTLERIDAGEFLTGYTKDAAEIYSVALKQFSLIKAVELREKSYKYAVKAAKGAYYPTLLLGGNVETNYSSTAENSAGKISYNDQVRNNIYTTVAIGLRVPIFNYFRTKNNIRLAGINLKNSELVKEDTKVKLRQQIEQAHLNMTNAYDRYKTLLQQVDAYTLSFKAAEARFNAGVGTSVDYLIAKNNVDRANINLISAKYDFVLRKKILDYYQNTTGVK